MTWGVCKYDIIHINDVYITAYERSEDVGGEVLVINRITGIYKRGRVGIFYPQHKIEGGGEGSLEAYIYEGLCAKQKF